MLTATHPYLITPTRYHDDEPATWPVSVCGPGGEFLGQTSRGTADGTTSYQGREYKLVPCDHAPHWTYLVPMPSVNHSVLFYSLCDEEAGGISVMPYKWFYTVALPHALAYVAALNKMAGSNRYSIKANY